MTRHQNIVFLPAPQSPRSGVRRGDHRRKTGGQHRDPGRLGYDVNFTIFLKTGV
jgi:hypothetical protein